MATGLAAPAIANSDPIKIGFLPALTGPSSSTGIGINRGMELAVEEINAAGGVNGRKIELIVRDTQGDPTKAVNAAPSSCSARRSRRSLGRPIPARRWRPRRSSRATRCRASSMLGRPADRRQEVSHRLPHAPTNPQIGGGANHYVLDVLKVKNVAVVSDTTGYGTTSVEASVPMLKARAPRWSSQAYRRQPTRPHARHAADAERRRRGDLPWSVNAGLLARMMNARGAMGWDVPSSASHARLRRVQGALGEAETGTRSTRRLPQLSFERRQAAGAHPGIRRAAAQGQARHGRHAAVVGRAAAMTGAPLPMRSRRRHQARRDHRLLEQAERLAGHFRRLSPLRPSSTTDSRTTRS